MRDPVVERLLAADGYDRLNPPPHRCATCRCELISAGACARWQHSVCVNGQYGLAFTCSNYYSRERGPELGISPFARA